MLGFGSLKVLNFLRKKNTNTSDILYYLYKMEHIKFHLKRINNIKYNDFLILIKLLSQYDEINITYKKSDNIAMYEYYVEYKGYIFVYNIPNKSKFAKKTDIEYNYNYLSPINIKNFSF